MESEFNKAYKFLIYDELYEYEDLINKLTKVLDDDPDNVICLNNRSIAYGEIGKIDKALIDIERARVLDPNNDTVKYNYESLRKSSESS